MGKGILEQIEEDEGIGHYNELTPERLKEIIKELFKPIPPQPELKFPSTEEIEALDDNLTYQIPTPVGYLYMRGGVAIEFNNQLVKEFNSVNYK